MDTLAHWYVVPLHALYVNCGATFLLCWILSTIVPLIGEYRSQCLDIEEIFPAAGLAAMLAFLQALGSVVVGIPLVVVKAPSTFMLLSCSPLIAYWIIVGCLFLRDLLRPQARLGFDGWMELAIPLAYCVWGLGGLVVLGVFIPILILAWDIRVFALSVALGPPVTVIAIIVLYFVLSAIVRIFDLGDKYSDEPWACYQYPSGRLLYYFTKRILVNEGPGSIVLAVGAILGVVATSMYILPVLGLHWPTVLYGTIVGALFYVCFILLITWIAEKLAT